MNLDYFNTFKTSINNSLLTFGTQKYVIFNKIELYNYFPYPGSSWKNEHQIFFINQICSFVAQKRETNVYWNRNVTLWMTKLFNCNGKNSLAIVKLTRAPERNCFISITSKLDAIQYLNDWNSIEIIGCFLTCSLFYTCYDNICFYFCSLFEQHTTANSSL